MSIIFDGIEWDYNNLSGINYNSDELLEPYATWFYLITKATNYEKESINLNLSDVINQESINKRKDNIIKLKDYSKRVISKKTNDFISIGDDSKRTAGKKFTETFNITENINRKVNKKAKDDVVYVLDEGRYIKTEDGVVTTVEQIELSGSISLFDFEINDYVWSENNFKSWCENNCPVNYNELRPFIPGEYEYTDAYVGFKLSSPLSDGKFGVVNSKVYIDVEDTVEKGTTDAEGGSLTRVEFSKRFYTTPRIITSLNYSQENSFIEVSTVTRDYFEFGLKSISSGQYVSGQINWLVDGY